MAHHGSASTQLPLFPADPGAENRPAQEIAEFLGNLKAEGKHSPTDWHRFSELLASLRKPGSPGVPPPMILAASGESPANKHHRLAEQLEWALANGSLEAAIQYLKQLPPTGWQCASPANWNRDTYPWQTFESQDSDAE